MAERKVLDLTRSVHDLVEDYPEVKDVMYDLGFKDIVKPMALNTMGRVMTIPKGAAIKEIDLTDIVRAFEARGFEVSWGDAARPAGEVDTSGAATGTSDDNDEATTHADTSDAETGSKAAPTGNSPQADVANAPAATPAPTHAEVSAAEGEERKAARDAATAKAEAEQAADEAARGVEERARLLKAYVARLSAGESLESVRADFVEHFRGVDATEIAHAEQGLIEGGAKVDDVQRLCDVHSALFHGMTATEQERGQNAADDQGLAAPAPDGEQAVLDSLTQGEPDEALARLAAIPGHPLNVLSRENAAIAAQVGRARAALGTDAETEELRRLSQLGIHYAKKGDLLYPPLKLAHGFSGPSEVMWGVDDEIRSDLGALLRLSDHDDAWHGRAAAVLDRIDEMTYKEANILLPLCAQSFTDEEWLRMYVDLKGYDLCLIDEADTWEAGERWEREHAGAAAATPAADADTTEGMAHGSAPATTGTLSFPTGQLTPAQVEALLDTLPLEVSFVDDHDINRYWNDTGEKRLFKRPSSALGREVYSCHPPKVEAMVRGIIASFRSGARDRVEVWMEKEGHPVLVRYLAVRDKAGAYVGTLEVVERMDEAREHFAK